MQAGCLKEVEALRKLEKFTPLPIPEEEQTDKISVIVAVYNIEALSLIHI